jgi:glycosyltransferase involved in cell wall biosynthesis
VQAQLPFYVRGGLLSFCNLAPVVPKKHIVCIHDLHTRLMPESFGRLFRWTHRVILPLLGWRATRITTVSELAGDHLVQFGVVPKHKIAVTYNGSDHAARWDKDSSQLALEAERPFVLCIGRPERYKNAELLIALAPLLDEAGIDLYVAGDLPASAFAAHAVNGGRNVRILGRISDNDLAKAQSMALCFLFPSRIEGFGLPAVEAMTNRCPVVASTSPCLPEICGEGVLYADPDDPGAWLAAIKRLHDDASLRRELIEKGHARAQRYTWRSIAERYLELMADVDGVKSPAGNDTTP